MSFRLRYQNKGEAYLDYVPDYIEKWKKILDIPIVAMMCGWEKIGEWAGLIIFLLLEEKDDFGICVADL